MSATEPGPWRIGGGIVIGWHARGVTQLEPQLVRDWEKFAKAIAFLVEALRPLG